MTTDSEPLAAPFRRTFHVGWGDMDFNGHMKNTAYLDRAADVRLMFFESRGFSVREFARLRVGPVIQREELEYFRELHLLQTVDVTLLVAGLSADGSRYRLRNEFFGDGGKKTATVTSTGGWLDHAARRLVLPPEEVARAMYGLTKTADFTELPSSVADG